MLGQITRMLVMPKEPKGDEAHTVITERERGEESFTSTIFIRRQRRKKTQREDGRIQIFHLTRRISLQREGGVEMAPACQSTIKLHYY